MIFLRRNKSKTNNKGPSLPEETSNKKTLETAGTTPATTKSKRKFGLFNKYKTGERKTAPSTTKSGNAVASNPEWTTSVNVAIVEDVQLLEGDELEHNTTVDTIESIVLPQSSSGGDDDEQQINQKKQEQQANLLLGQVNLVDGKEGTELFLPSFISDPTVFPDYEVSSESEDHPDDEPPTHHRQAKIMVQTPQTQNPLNQYKAFATISTQCQQQYHKEKKEEKTASGLPNNDGVHISEGKNEKDGSDEDPIIAAAAAAAASAMILDRSGKAKDATHDPQDEFKNNSIIVEEGINTEKANDQHPSSQKPPSTKAANAAATVSGALMKAFSCTAQDAENCATLPENIGGIMPITACQPIINQQYRNGNKSGRYPQRPTDCLNDQFAIKFLDDMLNVGFALVYHKSVNDGEDWVGRTVNMRFSPGICSTRQFVPPAVQWATMGGGKVNEVETCSIGLLNIGAIALSNIRNEKSPFLHPTGSAANASKDSNSKSNINNDAALGDWCNCQYADEELDCFFTITTKPGEVFLFEALSADESHRLVTGVKNLAFRFSTQMVEGDPTAITDFFDNAQEPQETQLAAKEAMMIISHAFLDNLL